ncbi:MAG TPA: DUF3592 domain-containing protein [Ignavibacteriaceae bacterium]|nr:DUF3592 domain-containing protein [Ignavibacteriaceae bacterium]
MTYYTYFHKRVVPTRVKFKILFGNFYTTFGLIFLIFSSIFIIVFSSFIKFDSLNKNSPVTEGIVTDVDVTKTTVNDQRVYAFHYEYKLPDGSLHSGKSFCKDIYYDVGTPVKVLYSEKEPGVSRIEGMGAGELSPWLLFIMIPFLLVGAGFFIYGLRKARKDIYLLQVGEVAYGNLVGKEPTSMKINNRKVYKLYFRFTTADGNTYDTACKSHMTHLLEDEEKEKLVYDPNAPEQALLLDSLPKKLKSFFEEVE